jgi:hypothetical protein
VLGVAAIGMIAASYYANSYALNSMPFRVREVTDFDFNTLSSSMQVDACNLTAFPATFDRFEARFEATMNYQRDDFASMPIDGGTVMPYQSTSLDGRPAVNVNTLSGLIIAFVAAMAGQDTAYNEDNISLTMTVDARVMGIVPYSQTHE